MFHDEVTLVFFRKLWHYFEDTDFKAEITSEIHKIEAELSKHEYFKEFQTFIQEYV